MNFSNIQDTRDLIMETNEEFIRIRTGLEKLIQPAAAYYGLTPTQVCVLNLIKKTEKATISSLFKRLDFNQGNMSSMCKKLEKDGFIKRKKCTDDERKSYLSLTPKANEVLTGIDKAFFFTDENSWITQEEFDRARDAFEILCKTAEKINERLSKFLAERKDLTDTNA